ncbi:MAG: hypothetical protein GQ475_04700 [Methylococcaceae bacterium]|nr:hypothetical protein [Methylococcaceae bacterium]
MVNKDLYLVATQEVEDDRQDAASWAKAMALAEGDKNSAKYKYIEMRVITLEDEESQKELNIEIEKKQKLEADLTKKSFELIAKIQNQGEAKLCPYCGSYSLKKHICNCGELLSEKDASSIPSYDEWRSSATNDRNISQYITWLKSISPSDYKEIFASEDVSPYEVEKFKAPDETTEVVESKKDKGDDISKVSIRRGLDLKRLLIITISFMMLAASVPVISAGGQESKAVLKVAIGLMWFTFTGVIGLAVSYIKRNNMSSLAMMQGQYKNAKKMLFTSVVFILAISIYTATASNSLLIWGEVIFVVGMLYGVHKNIHLIHYVLAVYAISTWSLHIVYGYGAGGAATASFIFYSSALSILLKGRIDKKY